MKFFTVYFCFVFFVFSVSPSFSASEDAAESSPKAFRGVSHIHSQYSDDSTASFRLILDESRARNLDFVIITDHNSMAAGVRGFKPYMSPDPPLVIFGNEISTPDGHLIALGVKEEPQKGMDTQAIIDWIHGQGGYAIVPHPFSAKHPWMNWDAAGLNGLEMYNFGHGLFETDTVDLYLRSFSESNESILQTVQEIQPDDLSFWEEKLAGRKINFFAGSDAHLKKSKRWFSLAFESVTVYALASAGDEASLLDAIGHGRTFFVFETNGLAKEFNFWAESGGARHSMGEEVLAAEDMVFNIHLPSAAKIVLIRDGVTAAEEDAQDLSIPSSGAGVYRVEVYRDGRLWLFSNPIYVKSE